MPQSIPVLQTEKLSKSFASPGGPVQVLRQVDLSIHEGEFVSVTGPSGSGKTTFLNLAALLDHPSTGKLMFDGLDASSLSESQLSRIRKNNVGMVFQEFYLLGHRSALENVMFRFRYLKTKYRDQRKRALEVLETLGLDAIAHQRARLLSSGEMQRVAIARAIALRPRLLVCDEPTGNLDRTATRTVMECFQELNRDGITILMATHNEALLAYCSRQIVCEDGRISE